MKIVSHGNQIRRGKYKLHSKFSSAVNFYSGDSFAFVVDERVGAGPLNIVLSCAALDPVRSLEIGNDIFYLNENRIPFKDTVLYDSNIHVGEIDKDSFRQNIQILEKAVAEYSPPKSLAFLIDERRKIEFTSSFEIEYVGRFVNAIGIYLSDDFLTGIKMVKGLGSGLTPGGDDFNSGVLIALNLLQKVTNTGYTRPVDQIYRAAIGKNRFTNAFLKCAARGFVFEKFKQLIQSLVDADKGEIINSTRRVLAMGDTSGADQAVGFLFGLKRF